MVMAIKIPKQVKHEKNIIDKAKIDSKKRKELYEAKEWYTIRAILGNDWANWFVLIGAR